MFFSKIVFDKICHAIEWKGVEGTKTWTDCIESVYFVQYISHFPMMGSVALLRPDPAPLPGAAQPEADPIAAPSTISPRQAHCAITKIYYFSPHQHLDQSHNNNKYRDGWWWEPFGSSFFINIYARCNAVTASALVRIHATSHIKYNANAKWMLDLGVKLFCLWKCDPVLAVNSWDAEASCAGWPVTRASSRVRLAISAITRRLGHHTHHTHYGPVSRSRVCSLLSPVPVVTTCPTSPNSWQQSFTFVQYRNRRDHTLIFPRRKKVKIWEFWYVQNRDFRRIKLRPCELLFVACLGLSSETVSRAPDVSRARVLWQKHIALHFVTLQTEPDQCHTPHVLTTNSPLVWFRFRLYGRREKKLGTKTN